MDRNSPPLNIFNVKTKLPGTPVDSNDNSTCRKHTITVPEFIDQCSRIGVSNFARYNGENYLFRGNIVGTPSDDALLSYLFQKEYKLLGEVLMSRYVESGN